MSRDELKALVKEHGGSVCPHAFADLFSKFVSTPSSSTTHVVLGAKPGAKKLASISALGIETIDEAAFMTLVADRQAGSRTNLDT